MPVTKRPRKGARRTMDAPVGTLSPDEATAVAVDGLRLRHPELSASRVLNQRQGLVILGILAACILGFFVAPISTGIALSGCIAAVYLLVFASNVGVFRRLIHAPHVVSVTDEEARAIPDDQLPVYTVMIAAYHEPEVIARTLRSLAGLDYPAHLLDIKLLLEADDDATRSAVLAAHPAVNVEVVLVPPSPAAHQAEGAQLRPAPRSRRADHHLRRRGSPRTPAAAPGSGRVLARGTAGGMPPGTARVPQPPSEPTHLVVCN